MPVNVAFEFEVETSEHQKKRNGANLFQSNRWFHAIQFLSARQSVDRTEDHHIDDSHAGGGEFQRSIQKARSREIIGVVVGSLIGHLDATLSFSDLKVAAAALSALTKLTRHNN